LRFLSRFSRFNSRTQLSFHREARRIYATSRIGANPQLYLRQSWRGQELEAQMKIETGNVTAKRPTREIEDSGRVRIGNTSPSFPPARRTPVNVADTGKVRIGNTSPSFPRVS
jgi:hypothetical protein